MFEYDPNREYYPALEFPNTLDYFWRSWRRTSLVSPQDDRIINGWLVQLSSMYHMGELYNHFPNKRLATFSLETQPESEILSLKIKSSLILLLCEPCLHICSFPNIEPNVGKNRREMDNQQQNAQWEVGGKYTHNKEVWLYNGGRYILNSADENIFFAAIVNTSLQLGIIDHDWNYAKPIPWMPMVVMNAAERVVFMTSKYEFMFLTCDGMAESDVSYWTIFLKPFDLWTWVWILITTFILAFTFDVIIQKNSKKR